jgi:hypothetical protein
MCTTTGYTNNESFAIDNYLNNSKEQRGGGGGVEAE